MAPIFLSCFGFMRMAPIARLHIIVESKKIHNTWNLKKTNQEGKEWKQSSNQVSSISIHNRKKDLNYKDATYLGTCLKLGTNIIDNICNN